MSDNLALPNQLRQLMRSMRTLHRIKSLRDSDPDYKEYWREMVRSNGAIVRERYKLIIDMHRTGDLK